MDRGMSNGEYVGELSLAEKTVKTLVPVSSRLCLFLLVDRTVGPGLKPEAGITRLTWALTPSASSGSNSCNILA